MRIIRREYPPVTGIIVLIINLVFGFIEIVIGLRIILELLGANQASSFVQWILSVSYPFIAPFTNIFPNKIFSGGYFLDSAAIFAFVVYALIYALIAGVIGRYTYIEEE